MKRRVIFHLLQALLIFAYSMDPPGPSQLLGKQKSMLPAGKDKPKEETGVINAHTTLYDSKKQRKLYQLSRMRMNQINEIEEYLTRMNGNLNSLKDTVKTRIDQMRQTLSSNLNTEKVFKITVDDDKPTD